MLAGQTVAGVAVVGDALMDVLASEWQLDRARQDACFVPSVGALFSVAGSHALDRVSPEDRCAVDTGSAGNVTRRVRAAERLIVQASISAARQRRKGRRDARRRAIVP